MDGKYQSRIIRCKELYVKIATCNSHIIKTLCEMSRERFDIQHMLEKASGIQQMLEKASIICNKAELKVELEESEKQSQELMKLHSHMLQYNSDLKKIVDKLEHEFENILLKKAFDLAIECFKHKKLQNVNMASERTDMKSWTNQEINNDDHEDEVDSMPQKCIADMYYDKLYESKHV